MRSFKMPSLVLLLFTCNLSYAGQELITSTKLKSNMEKTTCIEKAIENYFNYSNENPDKFANLSTLELVSEKRVAGLIQVIYSMTFLVGDKVEVKKTQVNSLDGSCF